MSTAQDALAGLRKWTLARDDVTDPGGRIYRGPDGTIYHSVTRILSATAPEQQKKNLARWLERPTSSDERDIAAQRGTLAHDSAEFLLRTAAKMSRNVGNRRGVWAPGTDGLMRCPPPITTWALRKALESAPKVGWSAAGYARGLKSWIVENVQCIHAIEFSIHHPAGFAGTCDALIDVDGKLTVTDWKTSARARSDEMLTSYKHQIGAYSLGLKHLTGIQPEAGAIVVARRSGAPQVKMLDASDLAEAEDKFLERTAAYFTAL